MLGIASSTKYYYRQAMHLYIQNAKTAHFRDRGNGWFRACWDISQTLMDHKFFVSCAPSGAWEVCVVALLEIAELC